GRGPRRIDGAVLDICGGSIFLGWSEKKTRGMIDRKLIPFRRIGRRIVFIRAELDAWLTNLPGCTAEEVRQNARIRQGVE
ncbi:MAG: helix-turn-helix domain-containing protein, partial [Nitrospirales bacterium]